MDDNQNQQEKILKKYEKQADNIISKMLNVLMRAERKKDDVVYRNILEKLQQKKSNNE